MSSFIFNHFLEKNQHIYIYEDDVWSIKGRYAMAIEQNDKVEWVFHKKGYVLPLRIVCFTTLL
jgi:hypothetical protein